MDLGATVCVSGTPKCGICPVRSFCRAENPSILPRKRTRTAMKRLTERHIFAVRNGRLLLQQSQERWRGMWILPRLAKAPARRRPLHSADFPFTHHRINLVVFAASPPDTTAADHRWFRISRTRHHPAAVTPSAGRRLRPRGPPFRSRLDFAANATKGSAMRSMTGYGRGEVDHARREVSGRAEFG